MRVLPKPVAIDGFDEPVTLAQLKGQVRADGGDSDDAMLMGYLVAARQAVELWLGRCVAVQPVRARFEHWPDRCLGGWPMEQRDLQLMAPVNSVDAISYTAADGSTAAWTGFIARTGDSGVTRVRPAYGSDWPALGNDAVITLDATAGFARCPEPIAQAICMTAAGWYANREGVVAGFRVGIAELPDVARLLSPYRWRWIG